MRFGERQEIFGEGEGFALFVTVVVAPEQTRLSGARHGPIRPRSAIDFQGTSMRIGFPQSPR